MGLMRRVPLWAWVVLAVAIYAGVQEYRIRALHGRLDAAQLEDLAKAGAGAKADLKAMEGQRAALGASIAGAKAEVTGLRRELGTLRAAFATQEVERQRLVTSGTIAEVLTLCTSLGYHCVATKRPTP